VKTSIVRSLRIKLEVMGWMYGTNTLTRNQQVSYPFMCCCRISWACCVVSHWWLFVLVLFLGTCAVLVTNHGNDRSLCANLAAANCFTIDHIHKPENKSYIDNAQFFYVSVSWNWYPLVLWWRIQFRAGSNNSFMFAVIVLMAVSMKIIDCSLLWSIEL